MSWIKIANKYGRYIETRFGFRVYCTKESEIIKTETDSQIHYKNEIGKYIAINKKGEILDSKELPGSGLMELFYQIEMHKLRERFNKKAR